MKIKEGYNEKEIEIKISTQPNGSIELWITQEGLPEECARYKETLSYMSPQELVELYKMVKQAGKDLFE